RPELLENVRTRSRRMGLEIVAPVAVERRGAHHRKRPEGEFRGQRGVWLRKIDFDGEIVGDIDVLDGGQHPGEREFPGDPPFEILLDRGRVERGAIWKILFWVKVQGRCQAVGGATQGFREPWNDLAGN